MEGLTVGVPRNAVSAASLWDLLREMAAAAITPPTTHPFYRNLVDHAVIPAGMTGSSMVKFVALVARPDRVTPEQFHRHWLEEHSLLCRSLAPALRMKRYVQSHVVVSPLLDSFGEGRAWPANPFTGMTEVWFESAEDMLEAFQSDAGQEASRLLDEDERRSVDGTAIVWATREYEIFNYLGR